jgi:RNA polymerase sigma-70 factor (ECF subfamily)
MRIVGNADIAQDVHQEVFLRIWRQWDRLSGRTHWDRYLYRATVRTALEMAKRLRRTATLADATDEPVAQSTDVDARVRAEELGRQLACCLAELPRRQAEVFVLARLEGMAHKTIAEYLSCSPRTVRVHLHRAVKRLARELDGFLGA